MATTTDAPKTTPPADLGRPRRRTVGATGPLRYAAMIGLGLVIVAPLLWMLTTSLRTNPDATRLPLSWIPRDPSVQGYTEIITANSETTPVLRWFVNSMVAATGQMLLVLAVASMAGFALARMEFRGKRVIFWAIILTLFIPGFVFLIPNFLIVNRLGWLDTLLALIVPGAAGAFGVFFFRQFFLSLPAELEEAALIDGANYWQIFVRVILPLSKPAFATLAVLSFLTNWNDFLWPVYVIFSSQNLTLPPGLNILQGAYSTDYPIIMAGAVMASVPVLALFFFTQRWVIEGVAQSGLKG
ncbi:MAG: carbohydrate ABC transporter permease [Jiangellaceae bacterium]